MILTKNARVALVQVLLAAMAGVAAYQCWTVIHQIARLEKSADFAAAVEELEAHIERPKGSK